MDPETEQPQEEQQTQDNPVEGATEPDEGTEPEGGDPHPLEPGGKRFAEVYRDMKDARREAADLRERIARLEGRQEQPQQPPQPQERFYTADELQGLVNAGKITPALMADQLAWQRTEVAKREIREQTAQQQKVGVAQSEIAQYLKKVPALTDQRSPEFGRVWAAAREIADELGRKVDDPIVQRRALREAFGSLEKLVKVKQLNEESRRSADTHSERPGGARQQAAPNGNNALKGVPQRYLDHWKRLGYSQEQMVEESKFIRRRA